MRTICDFVRLFVVFAGIAKHDDEGRVITAEYDKFYLVTACKTRLIV